MIRISDLLSAADLRKIGRLQVFARFVVEGFCSGLHRSPHKGQSVEFREHRAYVPGDELRRLDWRVYGRSDRFYVREYEEETNLRATLLLDASGSMAYGEGGLAKLDYAKRIAASLATLLFRQQDAVGLALFDTRIRRHIPPRAKPGHLRVLLQTLQDARPGGETALGPVLRELAPRLHRRGLLILISDLFDDPARLLPALAHLRHARHELIVFQVLHPDELEFPFGGWVRFDSLERSGMRVLADAALIRQAYREALGRFRAALVDACRRHRIDFATFDTGRPCTDALASYLATRLRRT